MREILFKAKRIDNGEWVEGYYVYVKCYNNHCIYQNQKNNTTTCFIIDVNTLSQFTGLYYCDKHIFENSIIKRIVDYDYNDMSCTDAEYLVIKYDKNDAMYKLYDKNMKEIDEVLSEIVNSGYIEWYLEGNIFDNPELLEK